MGRDSASDEPSASVSQKREADRGMEMMHTYGSEKMLLQRFVNVIPIGMFCNMQFWVCGDG